MHLERTQPSRLSEGWISATPDGGVELAEASRTEADAVGQTLTLKNTLPSPLKGNMSLCFQTKNESVRVWVDGELVYSYGETPQRIYGHGVGAVWNIAPIPDGSGGKEVTVELIPIGGRTGLAPYQFLLGSRSDVVSQLLRERGLLLAVSLLFVLIGTAGLLVSGWSFYKRGGQAAAAFYFSLFVLLAAVWLFADSGLFMFILSNKGVSYLMFGCSFYLLCTPFAMFMAYVQPERGRLYFGFSIVSSAYAVLRFILYATGVLDFETALWTVHLMITALMVVVNITLWAPAIRANKIERPLLCCAITVFTIAEAAALSSFYVEDKLDVLRNGYSSGFYIGILLLVVIVAAGSVRKVGQIRQQAFKAQFYERRAYTDELTGLLNVKGFDDKCAELLKTAPAKQRLAVVDFDVNYFSQYNATNGLEGGDELLRRIAGMLRELCRKDELCARQEADHFVCLVRGDSFRDIVDRIRESDRAVHGRVTEKMLILSYGIVEVTDRNVSVAALRNQAVVAKRTVKGNYENNIAVYDRELHEQQLREVPLLSGFEESLAKREYVIFLQPKIDVITEKLMGAEALVRLIDADGTVTGASAIIEALEHKGFVARLDYYILELVCGFLRRCRDEGRELHPVSCNFSRVHLYDADFPNRVAETVDKFEIPHSLVELELTETAFLAGKDILQTAVRRLHSHGFCVTIDDFGSGYSSLNMLKDVEVDSIKLDREFLTGFSDNLRADTVIEHTLKLAQEMGITTVAEGIETKEQLRLLRRHGCDLAQGFYYSHPLPVEEFIEKYLPISEVKQS